MGRIVAARLERDKGSIAHELAVATGSSLEDARQRVEAYLQRLSAVASSQTPSAKEGTYDDILREEVARMRAGAGGGKIQLIKVLRDRSGLGLRESKEATEEYLQREAPDLPELSRTGCFGVLLTLFPR